MVQVRGSYFTRLDEAQPIGVTLPASTGINVR